MVLSFGFPLLPPPQLPPPPVVQGRLASSEAKLERKDGSPDIDLILKKMKAWLFWVSFWLFLLFLGCVTCYLSPPHLTTHSFLPPSLSSSYIPSSRLTLNSFIITPSSPVSSALNHVTFFKPTDTYWDVIQFKGLWIMHLPKADKFTWLINWLRVITAGKKHFADCPVHRVVCLVYSFVQFVKPAKFGASSKFWLKQTVAKAGMQNWWL